MDDTGKKTNSNYDITDVESVYYIILGAVAVSAGACVCLFPDCTGFFNFLTHVITMGLCAYVVFVLFGYPCTVLFKAITKNRGKHFKKIVTVILCLVEVLIFFFILQRC